MGDLDPVPWDAIEAALGVPEGEVVACVDRLADDVRGDDPYDAVKAIHDALAREGDRTLPDQGEVFVIAYLLEKRGVIAAGSDGDGLPSVADRRPGGERLRELFWGRERTRWWIAIRLGVHWALVRLWLREERIPLRERNFGAESMARIRECR